MNLTCIECPMGCEIEVVVESNTVASVTGYGCLRGKQYAQNEAVCPRRVLTSSVRAKCGKMISVKTDAPIKKEEIFDVMKKINDTVIDFSVKIGQVLVENITENINLVATCNLNQ